MKSVINNIARRLGLRAAYKRWKRVFRWRWFRGDYNSWRKARLASSGYEDRAIMERAAEAARKVHRGEAAWERDGFTFAAPSFNEPLLAALNHAAENNDGKLTVVDIGGAFGGVLRQHWSGLKNLKSVDWRIVEQPDFVAAGRSEFTDEILSFHSSIEAACAGKTHHVALLSSVLPYLEFPMQMLREVTASNFEHIIVDRTPFVRRKTNKLVVQFVPPDLGGGSYPCWLFSRDTFVAEFLDGYEKVNEWPGFDDPDPAAEFRGFHFRKRAIAGPREHSLVRGSGI